MVKSRKVIIVNNKDRTLALIFVDEISSVHDHNSGCSSPYRSVVVMKTGERYNLAQTVDEIMKICLEEDLPNHSKRPPYDY